MIKNPLKEVADQRITKLIDALNESGDDDDDDYDDLSNLISMLCEMD